MKRLTALFLVLAAFLSLFTACGEDEIPDGPAELWVVTEQTSKYGMNTQARMVTEQFAELYPNVTVKMDILPTDDEERAAYLQKLRTQIMSGGGPDLYLLPTNSVAATGKGQGLKRVEPLFRDVERSMHNYLFYDISEFYDTDETLNKDALNTSVMDGCVIDGARYALPLRYDIGVYLVDRENLEALGGSVEVFSGTYLDVVNNALALGNEGLLFGSISTDWSCCLPKQIDYVNGTLNVTEEAVAEFMRCTQLWLSCDITTLSINGFNASPLIYIYDGTQFADSGFGVYATSLSTLPSDMLLANLLGEDLEMYPIRDCNGSINATIDYYAAVGAGSTYPRLAYEFAKLFLQEELQHETYMTSTSYGASNGTACSGYPVLTVGSAEPMAQGVKTRVAHDKQLKNMFSKRYARITNDDLTVTDEDIPAMNWQVDHVSFGFAMDEGHSLGSCMDGMFNYETQTLNPDFDIAAAAKQYMDNLQIYLLEG